MKEQNQIPAVDTFSVGKSRSSPIQIGERKQSITNNLIISP